MDVTLYGVRGSIPAPGPNTLRYGGNTVSISVQLADGTVLILDAGTGLREFGRDLESSDEPPVSQAHLLLSHLHFDHVIGLPFFAPMFRQDFELLLHPVVSDRAPNRDPREAIFDGIHTPMGLEALPSKTTAVLHEAPVWTIGSARVQRIELNHPGGSQGFRIDDADGASITYLTDNELLPPGAPRSTPEEQARFAAGTGLLVADAQLLPEDLPEKRGWGHSTIPEALQLGRSAQPLCQLLFHHDPDRSDDALDLIGEQVAAFAEAEFQRGPALVAKEGMRFRLSADSCLPLPPREAPRF
ncbi:MAG: MBL fold metallo-hydrolase [Myxococcota bacterium]|nr:MBL fold metallo-hydrolase [Myxococcota bacterium]